MLIECIKQKLVFAKFEGIRIMGNAQSQFETSSEPIPIKCSRALPEIGLSVFVAKRIRSTAHGDPDFAQTQRP
ncbi:hypothetical protein VTO42DRAFT_3962 [Malbranchea cinnamomea]